jgi:hypothetical protein
MLIGLGLESRIIRKAEEVDLKATIDWAIVNKKMERKKEMSMDYLKKEMK